MLCVANVITYIVVLELLSNFSSLVHYNLNRFRSPWVKQFDILALLFGGYARFIPLNKMVFYGYFKTLPSSSSSMLYIALTLFPLCNVLCCSIYHYYLNNSNIVLRYVCFYYCLSGWNYIISLTTNYWKLFWPRFHAISVRKF